MRRVGSLLGCVVLLAAIIAAGSIAGAMPKTWSTTLSAAQEIPKQAVTNTAAHGTFKATLTGTKLKFTLTFSGLTGPATMAHIHLGAKGKSGPILITLCTPCKSPVSKTVTADATVQKDYAKHLLYVNVHTKKNPNGEIRGQLNA
jgi:CHRD domain